VSGTHPIILECASQPMVPAQGGTGGGWSFDRCGRDGSDRDLGVAELAERSGIEVSGCSSPSFRSDAGGAEYRDCRD